MSNRISKNKIKKIISFSNIEEINKRRAARNLNISRTTLKKYLSELERFNLEFPDRKNNVNSFINFIGKTKHISERKTYLNDSFPSIFKSIETADSNIKAEWEKYKIKYSDGYCLSQFCLSFSKWLHEQKLIISPKNSKLKTLPNDDLTILRKWRLSTDRRKWERAVILLDSYEGKPISEIEKKVERSHDKIIEWIKIFEKDGLKGLEKKKKKISVETINNIETKKANLITLIHETPKNFGINRTSWSLKSLNEAYSQKYGVTISISMISEYIKSLGYAFRKAKKVLTSPDPKYREKLQNITNILSNLTDKQKFFSVDEFGPFAIKIKGGISIVKIGETKTYPQMQKSKGSLICTAGLELSTNQITHFYSFKKNTDEMIKLLEILLVKYKNEEKIYFSWDAASWHASKKLKDKIEEVNKDGYRDINHTPLVELAPLPASAQFLNVIESVFSGMSKGIIHNSDYQSVDDCKTAIDQYFKERNEYFQKYPKRAGKKIWGRETNISKFDESKNYKDSRWR